VVEEELLPGTSVTIPEPGRRHYPTWHCPFNRAPGLAEVLVPDREDAFYRTFLRQSAGPVPLDEDAEHAYVLAYSPSPCLAATLGYYRTSEADARSVTLRSRRPIDVPVLTVGGRFGMGTAVAECFATVARHVTHQQVDGAGHYPAEQRPEIANDAIVSFILHHMATW
jgi:pimeloyl-ACP methyl ester carboxylesterase